MFDWVFSFYFGLANFFNFASTCVWSNSLAYLLQFLGHSFVQRLSSDVRANFDAHAAEHFSCLGDTFIHLHGVGRSVL